MESSAKQITELYQQAKKYQKEGDYEKAIEYYTK